MIFDAALGASSLSWSLVQPIVARVTQTCSYDRAGFGWSEAGPFPRTAGRIADELFQLLRRAVVPGPYVLVGHSYGGFVMQLLASRHPQDIAGLVLIEPAIADEWVNPAEQQRAQIARGVRLCGYGVAAARRGFARVVSTLVNLGAIGPARAVVRLVSRGGFGREDEGILAPIWKLPPDARGALRQIWTQPKFFEALGSQIGSICESAKEVVRDASLDYGELPLIVMTAASACASRLKADAALALRSRRGRHLLVADSGHWIPLDAPQSVIDAVRGMVLELRGRPQ